MRTVGLSTLLVFCGVWIGCMACSTRQDPDQLRKKTAETTANLKSDAKAIAQGVREGLKTDQTVDINRGSKQQLTQLPGIDGATADRVIASRPYQSTHDLLARRIVSQEEYGRIRDRITAR